VKKIYNPREFVLGLVCLALAAICGVMMALQGISVKLTVSMALLLALGWVDLSRSADRQMRRAATPDERDRAVSRQSAWRAYQLLVNGCMLAAVVLMVVYGIWRSQLVAAALLTLCLVLLAAFAILLGVNLYYEKRM
jgi:uncharacterized membrane protein